MKHIEAQWEEYKQVVLAASPTPPPAFLMLEFKKHFFAGAVGVMHALNHTEKTKEDMLGMIDCLDQCAAELEEFNGAGMDAIVAEQRVLMQTMKKAAAEAAKPG